MADITENPSPLEFALLDFLNKGQQLPFFLNTEWLQALQVFGNSGITDPTSIGGSGPVIMIDDDIFTIEPKPDCGPDDTDRYENVFRGKVDSLFPPDKFFKFNLDGCIRGGSCANGAGGPWATGGLVGPDVNPYNSAEYPDGVSFPITELPADVETVLNQQAADKLSGTPSATAAVAFQGIF